MKNRERKYILKKKRLKLLKWIMLLGDDQDYDINIELDKSKMGNWVFIGSNESQTKFEVHQYNVTLTTK